MSDDKKTGGDEPAKPPQARKRRRLPRSWLAAGAVVVALVLWFASGIVAPPESRQAAVPVEERARATVSVEVAPIQAQPVMREIVMQGHSEPDRVVTVRAETAGQVAELVAPKGARVKPGDVLLRLKKDDRDARLREAEANVRQAESTYQAYARLAERGHQARNQVTDALAALETARAQLERIRIEIENTTVEAPIEGVLETRPVEVGDYLAVNTEIATIVDVDPLVVVGFVPQQSVDDVKIGGVVNVHFVTGQKREGRIRYVATAADVSTRTFRLEAEIANPNGDIPAGISAELRVPIGTVQAHQISPALLSLGEDGSLGVKAIEGENTVRLYPIEIVRASVDGIWVAGLPPQTTVITRGQGFVAAGERVEVVPRPEPTPAAAAPSAEAARAPAGPAQE